jgi:hypothetical protein
MVAHAGDSIVLTGSGFQADLTITLTQAAAGRRTLPVRLDGVGRLSTQLPDDMAPGPFELVARQDRQEQALSFLLARSGAGSVPTFTGDARKICAGHAFYDAQGELQTGTRPCGGAAAPSTCSADGEVGCIATPAYAAAQTGTLAKKVVTGRTVGGVSGDAGAPADCDDGETDCVVRSPLAPATATELSPANIREGVTLAGVAGTLRPAPAACATDGAIDCVATATYPAAALANASPADIKIGKTIAGVAGALTTCAADGATGCLSNPAYKAVDMAGVTAGHVKAGVTIAGVAGTVTPAPAACASDGGSGCVVDGTSYKAAKMANVSAARVRIGTTVAGVAGSLGDCASDGATGCVTHASFKAADMTRVIAANVKAGTTIAGVLGSLAPAPADCAADGDSGCVVDGTSYKAAKLANVTAASMRIGATAAGVAGSLDDCAVDAETECITVAAFKAADMARVLPSSVRSGVTIAGVPGAVAAAPADCAADGAAGCVTTTTYKSADTTGFSASDLRSGKTVAGVHGSLLDCGADGATDCVTVAAYPAARLANFTAGDIKTGVTIATVGGTMSDCAADGVSGCVAVPTFKAADMAVVTTAAIRSGITIAGVGGDFPSVTNRLPGASATTDLASLAGSTPAGSYEWWGSDGARYTGTITDAGVVTPGATDQTFDASVYRQFTVAGDADLTAGKIKDGVTLFGVPGGYPSAAFPLDGMDGSAELDAATFDAKLKTTAAFQWFDATGAHHGGAGMTQLTGANLADGVTIFGATGTLISGSACSSDGQVGCVATTRYKSIDTDPSAISAWDIRTGKSAGGLAGKLAFYKDGADLGFFDRASGTGGASGIDMYDSIVDYAGNGAFPQAVPAGWLAVTGDNWERDPTSDTDGDGTCNGAEACAYRDLTTNVVWARTDATQRYWEESISVCEALNAASFGGYSSGWRMPAQKDVMQAYSDGIWSQHDSSKLNIANVWHWTATTYGSTPTKAWYFYLALNSNGQLDKTSQTAAVICVH